MRRGELCESAKRGKVCIDDLCHGADVTLCGFDRHFYETEIERDSEDIDAQAFDPDGCLICGQKMCDCDPEGDL
jgi:hypothetical protein